MASAGVLEQLLGLQALAARLEVNVNEAIACIWIIWVVDHFGGTDFDAVRGNQIDHRREHVEVDEQVFIDFDAEVLGDGGGRERRTTAGVGVEHADTVGGVDAAGNGAGNIHPEVARDRQHADGLTNRIDAEDDYRIGVELAGFAFTLVNAKQENVDAARVGDVILTERVNGGGGRRGGGHRRIFGARRGGWWRRREGGGCGGLHTQKVSKRR